MVYLHQEFLSIQAAQEAIKQHVLDEGKSYKTEKSDKQRFVIVCKDDNCKFQIRAAVLEKEVVSITVFKPHSCSPAIHYKSWQSQSIKYLVTHHRATVIDNCNITAKQTVDVIAGEPEGSRRDCNIRRSSGVEGDK